MTQYPTRLGNVLGFAFAYAVLIATGIAEATPPRGGAGGAAFQLDCGSESVLAGVVVRAGQTLGGVDAVCVRVKPDGTWSGSPVVQGRAGGTGGAPYALSCDAGWAVFGIAGRSGALVDALGVRCGRLGVRNNLLGVVDGNTFRGPAGGAGGSPFDDFCASGQAGRGLKGRAGAFVDQIELTCHNPSAMQPVVTAPAMQPGIAAPARPQMAPSAGVPGITGLVAPPVKLEVTRFDLLPLGTPTWPRLHTPSANPTCYIPSGCFYVKTVSMTVKNAGAGAVTRVPWSIHDATRNRTLASGEQANVAPNTEFTVTASWSVDDVGTYRLQGYIDPAGNILRNTAPVAQQIKEMDVQVTPLMSERKLTAMWVPGGITLTPDTSGHTCARGLEVRNERSYVTVDCLKSPLGARVTVEAFKNLQLQNGWRVKDSYSAWEGYPAVVSEQQKPGPGSTSPFYNVRIAVEGSKIGAAYLVVTIEGPEHTWFTSSCPDFASICDYTLQRRQ